MDVWGKEDEVKEGGEEKAEESLVPGGAPPEPPYLLPPPEKKEGEENPKTGGFDIKIFRLAAPIITKLQRKSPKPPWTSSSNSRWTAATSEDRGHEFSGLFRKWANSRGIVLTRTPGDDPRANGRAEVAVKSLKTQIRRLLKQADVGSEYWPLAALCRCFEQELENWRCAELSTFSTRCSC